MNIKISGSEETKIEPNVDFFSPTEVLFDNIRKGREGGNWGLNIGMNKLQQLTSGLTPRTYYVIFGPSGSGKTTFTLYTHVFIPLYENINPKLIIVYYSLEMSADVLYGKLLSMYVQTKTGIEISLKEMLSIDRGYKLNDKLYNILLEAKAWLKEIESRFIIYDRPLTPSAFDKHSHSVFSRFGKFKVEGTRQIYIPDDPERLIVGVLDHYGLIRHQGSLKLAIDEISSTAVRYRNMCNGSFIGVAQVNRKMTSMERRNSEHKEPERSDLKDSGNIEQDCDVMMAIYDPNREKLMEWRNYDVDKLRDTIRGVILLKNRYGLGDKAIGCAFYGRSGIWRELPKGNEINDYRYYQTVNGIEALDTSELRDIANNLSENIASTQENSEEDKKKSFNFTMQ